MLDQLTACLRWGHEFCLKWGSWTFLDIALFGLWKEVKMKLGDGHNWVSIQLWQLLVNEDLLPLSFLIEYVLIDEAGTQNKHMAKMFDYLVWFHVSDQL